MEVAAAAGRRVAELAGIRPLERTDLVVTVPSQVARLFEKMGRFKSLKPPVRIPTADVRVHWHERFERDAANRWLRELVVGLYAE